ncbi:putative Ig domain-containing protein [Brevifollis gellanilyticus]|uniref:Uncharacterized protein n=1 Tax=Brevifollis gellanilyticus TaxID=748831 RepID=A0A512MHT4_9BACT|nr:putative Ig domain-containing protein [Brevifollis gellanilyticus]GEP46292.1 hypothetical protein BGE01nite_55830 [Brevifollis gellanilyticus]
MLSRSLPALRSLVTLLGCLLFLLATTATSRAVVLPSLRTPWDSEVILRPGDEVWVNLWLDSEGDGSGKVVFSCSGLPPGLRLDPADGTIRGTVRQPGLYTVTARASVGGLSSAPAVRRIAVVPEHLPTPGVYERVLSRDSAPPLGGHLSILIQPTGSYSGLLRTGTRRTPVAGTFKEAAPGSPSTSTRFLLPYENRLFLAELFYYRGDAPGLTIVDTASPVSNLGLLSLVRPSVGTLPPCPQLGRHAVGLPFSYGPGNGSGYGSVQISADYRVNFVGQNPEGTGLTGSCIAEPVGGERVLGHLFATDGATTSLLGDPLVPSTQGLESTVKWVRLSRKGWQYADYSHVESDLTFLASRVTPRTLAAYFPSDIYDLRVSQNDIGLSTSTDFLLTSGYRAHFGSPADDPLRARLDIYTPTGFFSGRCTVTLMDPVFGSDRFHTRTVNFSGMLLPEYGFGVGRFVIRQLPNPEAIPPVTAAQAPFLSGSVDIFPTFK